jgi:hypothetical protein
MASASAIKSFSVYDGRTFQGRIRLHGNAGIEAVNTSGNSLGVFASEREAANDITANAAISTKQNDHARDATQRWQRNSSPSVMERI